jgi:uncharacterized membrane protein YhaH (DUF805 family)
MAPDATRIRGTSRRGILAAPSPDLHEGIAVDWKNLLFSFEGRVGRGPYWGLVVASLLLFGLLGGASVMSMLNGTDPAAASGGMSMAMLVASLLFLWPALAIQAKRWHDVDKSAWWILINLVPAIGGLIALVFNGFIAGTPGANRFGPPAAARTAGRVSAA